MAFSSAMIAVSYGRDGLKPSSQQCMILLMTRTITERSKTFFATRRADNDEPVEVLAARKPTAKALQICREYALGRPVKQIAASLGVSPSRIYNVLGKPSSRQFVEMQLEAMFSTVVEAIGDVLVNGADADRLRAARLQMEATGRLGPRARHRVDPVSQEESFARLDRLAYRLIALQAEVIRDGCTVGVTPKAPND